MRYLKRVLRALVIIPIAIISVAILTIVQLILELIQARNDR